jgi:hypothetical protein
MEKRKASSIVSNEQQKDSMIVMESRHPNGGRHGPGNYEKGH